MGDRSCSAELDGQRLRTRRHRHPNPGCHYWLSLYRRSALEALDLAQLKAAGYGFLIQIAYRIWRSGGRLTKVPITFYGRRKGASKMSKRMMLEAAILVWRLRLGGGKPGSVKSRLDRQSGW